MILYYKNSVLASAVSIIGCIFAVVLVVEFESYDFVTESLPLALIALTFLIGGKLISNCKAFKTWWKQVEKANLIDAIKTDVSVAKTIYSKNPKPATLKKIEALNPAAALQIRAGIGKK